MFQPAKSTPGNARARRLPREGSFNLQYFEFSYKIQNPVFKSRNPPAVAMETQNASLEELLEVRIGLECNAAALAARRADRISKQS